MSCVFRLLFMSLFELDAESLCTSSTHLQAKQATDKTRFYHVNCWCSRNNPVKCHTKTHCMSENYSRKLKIKDVVTTIRRSISCLFMPWWNQCQSFSLMSKTMKSSMQFSQREQQIRRAIHFWIWPTVLKQLCPLTSWGIQGSLSSCFKGRPEDLKLTHICTHTRLSLHKRQVKVSTWR